MENYKHFEMKYKYREETNTDVYADEDVLTSKPTGSFSNKYVSWLEKIAWEGMNADKSSANCAIFDVMASVSDKLLLKAGKYEDEANADLDTEGAQHNLNIGRYDGLMQAVQEIKKHLP